MAGVVGTIREIIRDEMRALRVAELGVVRETYSHADAQDQDNYACDVELKNSGLVLKRVPVATGHIGTASIPNVNDLVILAFDKGDVNQGIVLGRLYCDADRPPLSKPDEVIFRLPLAKPDADTIMAAIRNHRADRPPREIKVEMPPKITVRITDGTVRVTAGNTEMKLDQPGSGDGVVTVMAGGTTITMNQDGDLSVQAAGAMKLQAARSLEIEALSVKITSQTSAEVAAGTNATVKAGVAAVVQGGASSTLQGATVSVKGITSFSP